MNEQAPAGGNEQEVSDDELIAQLSRIAAEADPVPDLLLAAARDAFAMREFDARVAELIYDSAVDAPAGAVRGSGLRTLSFESADVAVDCEVSAHESGRDIFGQFVAGYAARVDAQPARAATVTVGVDAQGCFGVSGLPAGPLRLRCHLADGSTVVTSWAVILRRYLTGAPPSTAAKRSLTVAAVWSGGASQTAALKISTSTKPR